MSKATLKKYLGSLDKSEVIDVVLDLYDARKEAKEYLEYFLNPDETAKMKEYKAIIGMSFGRNVVMENAGLVSVRKQLPISESYILRQRILQT